MRSALRHWLRQVWLACDPLSHYVDWPTYGFCLCAPRTVELTALSNPSR